MGVIEGLFLNKTEEGFKSDKSDDNRFSQHMDFNLTGYGIGTLINILLTGVALYFYFKCNWSKGGKFSVKASNLTDKLLGFLASCCCSICYIAYHLAIPC